MENGKIPSQCVGYNVLERCKVVLSPMTHIKLPDKLLFVASNSESLDSDANNSRRDSVRPAQRHHGNVVLRRERHANGCATVTRIL